MCPRGPVLRGRRSTAYYTDGSMATPPQVEGTAQGNQGLGPPLRSSPSLISLEISAPSAFHHLKLPSSPAVLKPCSRLQTKTGPNLSGLMFATESVIP